MSPTTNTHDESAATAATVSNHYAGVNSLEGSATTKNYNMALTSGAVSVSSAGTPGGSTCEQEDNEQAAINHLDRLYESWLQSLGEVMEFKDELYRVLCLRAMHRSRNQDLTSPLGEVEIGNVSQDDLDLEQLIIEGDTAEIKSLGILCEQYRVYLRTISSILDAAERVLGEFDLASETVAYEAAKRKMIAMERDSSLIKSRINTTLRTVFLSGSEAITRFRFRLRRI